ncbi:MAG: chromosomal replication initiator protein DnaA [Holosporales bacterium]|jgi:chromosomal replication initiator protein|nr:chromosomal replication initiator protein DnaA [Holosporales bacterium]
MLKYESAPKSALTDINTLWVSILADIAENVGTGCCRSWFEKASPISLADGFLLMRTRQRIVRDRLLTQYNQVLLSTWQKYVPQLVSIDIMVDSDDAHDASPAPLLAAEEQNADNALQEGYHDCGAPQKHDDTWHRHTDNRKGNGGSVGGAGTGNAESRNAGNGSVSTKGEASECGLDLRFTFENFVVGKPNEFAYAAATRVAESESVQFNPLFLYGGVGLGKTHLMHAIAWNISTKSPSRRVVYMSAEKFMYQFIRAIRYHDTMAFKEQFRSVDVLMIDDFQFIGGKETTQEEFFHTFNTLVDNNRQIIISADKSPSDLENIGERLKSRLAWGLVADIHPTTYELRLGILQSKAEMLNLSAPKEVFDFLATKITSNVRELEGALNRIMAHSFLVGRDVTLESTQEVLKDILRSNERYITIEDIQRRVSEFFSIKTADLLSSRRVRSLVRPRQVAMYLSKELTAKSLPEIGRKFGGKDHATVIYAMKKVLELCESDAEFAHDLDTLRTSLLVCGHS